MQGWRIHGLRVGKPSPLVVLGGRKGSVGRTRAGIGSGVKNYFADLEEKLSKNFHLIKKDQKFVFGFYGKKSVTRISAHHRFFVVCQINSYLMSDTSKSFSTSEVEILSSRDSQPKAAKICLSFSLVAFFKSFTVMGPFSFSAFHTKPAFMPISSLFIIS